MVRSLLLVLPLTLLTSCAADLFSGAAGGEPLVVRSGTSFGMCVGHCSTVLTVDSREIVFEEISRDAKAYPPRVQRRPISEAEWREVRALASDDAFFALEKSYGCPDCADGGAEWVEVERDGRSKRVVLEYGRSLPGADPLLARLREIRARFR